MGHYYAEMAGLTDSPNDEELNDDVPVLVGGRSDCSRCERLEETIKDLQSRVSDLEFSLEAVEKRELARTKTRLAGEARMQL